MENITSVMHARSTTPTSPPPLKQTLRKKYNPHLAFTAASSSLVTRTRQVTVRSLSPITNLNTKTNRYNFTSIGCKKDSTIN